MTQQDEQLMPNIPEAHTNLLKRLRTAIWHTAMHRMYCSPYFLKAIDITRLDEKQCAVESLITEVASHKAADLTALFQAWVLTHEVDLAGAPEPA